VHHRNQGRTHGLRNSKVFINNTERWQNTGNSAETLAAGLRQRQRSALRHAQVKGCRNGLLQQQLQQLQQQLLLLFQPFDLLWRVSAIRAIYCSTLYTTTFENTNLRIKTPLHGDLGEGSSEDAE
jgi:hypothetical protein